MPNRFNPGCDCCGECITRTYNPTWPGFSLTDAEIDGSNRIEIDAGGIAEVSVPSSSDYTTAFKVTRKTTGQDFEFLYSITPGHVLHVRGTSTTLLAHLESCAGVEFRTGTCVYGPGETIEGVYVKIDREWTSPAQVKIQLEVHPLRANGTLHPDVPDGFGTLPANRIRNTTFTSCISNKNATKLTLENIGSAILLLRDMSFAGGPEDLDCLTVTGGNACCHGNRPHQIVVEIGPHDAYTSPTQYFGTCQASGDFCGETLPSPLGSSYNYTEWSASVAAYAGTTQTVAATSRTTTSTFCGFKPADLNISLPSVSWSSTLHQKTEFGSPTSSSSSGTMNRVITLRNNAIDARLEFFKNFFVQYLRWGTPPMTSNGFGQTYQKNRRILCENCVSDEEFTEITTEIPWGSGLRTACGYDGLARITSSIVSIPVPVLNSATVEYL